MKLINKMLLAAVLAIAATCFVTSTFAQKQKSKEELFKEIVTLSNTKKPEDTEKAYQLSKEFLNRFPKEKDENAQKLKKFVKGYRENSFFKAYEEKKFADVFAIGKEILADEPDNISISMNLGYAGYDAMLKSNDKSFGDDSIKYSKQTLQLFEAGKVPASFAPFSNKDEAFAWMYYVIGFFSTEKDPKESAINFYKSTLYESSIKKTAQPYYVIAFYYESVYEKMSAEFSAKSKAKTIDDAQINAETEKINIVLDQMIDAYARAYKFGEIEKNPSKDEWKKRLTEVYLFRKRPEAALDAYLNYVMATPLKDPGGF
ncbi:MAG: hypothetical protein ABJA66_19370 [Actinomycetota bacterium]